MMTSIRRAALAALLLAPAFAGAAQAAGEGRVIGTVVDEAGAPIEGAKAVLTRGESGYKLEKVSDRKGQFMLLILDATQTYQIHIEKAGYGSYQGEVKPKLEDTIRLSFTLPKTAPAAAAPATAPAPKELSGADQAILAYNEGVTALRAGNVAGAVPNLEKAAALNPSLAEAQGTLADVYLELRRYGDALAAADRYLALKPGDPQGLRARYDALRAAGDGETARQALQALAAAEPRSPETAVRYFNEGAELARKGKLDEAAVFFQRVVEIAPADPKFAKAHYVLGMTFAKEDGKKDLAREQLQEFLKMAPN
ncbi:MAG TPA: tetratricopeptide repeat protein, partial [Thermoanaerobaculia bacterium]